MKTNNYQTEEQKEMYKFIIVLLILIAIIVGVYFLSKILIKNEVNEYAYTAGEVNDTVAIVGTILNQAENQYYVLAYDSTKSDAQAYNTYASYYTSNHEDALKIYYLDLNNGMNKPYYVEENSNQKATKISDLKIKNGTLLKINKGKITKYIEGMDAIKNELKTTAK